MKKMAKDGIAGLDELKKNPNPASAERTDETAGIEAGSDRKDEFPRDALNRNLEELGMPPQGQSEDLMRLIPIIGLLRSLGQQGEIDQRLKDPDFLHNTAGKALETNYQHGAPFDTFGKEAEIPMMAEGGMVEKPESGDVEIPEDVKEYVEKLHVQRQESRPDEGWRMVPGEKPVDEIPYKRDEEDDDLPEASLEDAASMAEVPGFAEGGVVDQNDLLAQLAPQGTGMVAPSPASTPAPEAPMPAEPAAPAPALPPTPVAPQSTDADYMEKANKLLGLDAGQQAGFMKLLGDRSQKAQLGSAVAGIGDAIASGGTLGKVNPGALNKSEELIKDRENAGLTGMQTIRSNQKEAQELGDKLQARDPNSPLSRYAQKAYGAVGKKIGIDLSHASASLIADVTGKGVEALNTELQNQLKTMGLDLQKKTLDATIANQRSERDIATAGRREEGAKALANRSTLQAIAGAIPGTAANASKKVLENEMKMGTTGDAGPYGQETVRGGKTYEWSQETGKYHLKR